jgi:hypothetical protein
MNVHEFGTACREGIGILECKSILKRRKSIANNLAGKHSISFVLHGMGTREI